MNKTVETVVFWVALLACMVMCITVFYRLMRWVQRGKTGRILPVFLFAFATPFLGIVPVFITYFARWLGSLARIAIFPKVSADDGSLVGIGILECS